jgi:hypothetical protein
MPHAGRSDRHVAIPHPNTRIAFPEHVLTNRGADLRQQVALAVLEQDYRWAVSRWAMSTANPIWWQGAGETPPLEPHRHTFRR